MRMSWQPISIWTADTMQRRLVEGDDYDAVPRQEMPMLPLEQRFNLTTEVELGFTHDEAFEEAKRCLQCQLNIFVDGDNCILCNACVEVCPVNVIHMADLELIDSINDTAVRAAPDGGQGLEGRRRHDHGREPVHPLRPVRADLPDQLHHHAALRAAPGRRAQRGRACRGGRRWTWAGGPAGAAQA